jgi:hypothetical protein
MDPSPIRELLSRVRSRWRRLLVFQAAMRAALAAAAVIGIGLLLASLASGAPGALALLGVTTLVLAAVAIVWGFWPARDIPTDARVARFIEERNPALDDRLVSAVDLMRAEGATERSALAGSLLADADRAAAAIDPASIIPGDILRRAGIQATAAVLLLAVMVFSGRERGRQSFDAFTLALFPSRVSLEVLPGNARIAVGSPLSIEARLVGNRAPVIAQLMRAELTEDETRQADLKVRTTSDTADADARLEKVRLKPDTTGVNDTTDWQAAEMTTDASGTFRFQLDSVGAPFKYRVVAGTVTSPTFAVTVARPPRVTRIDVEYRYPAALGLAPQTEEDSGDIYAPAGTEVRLRAHVDRPSLTGQLTLGDGTTVPLAASPAMPHGTENVLTGTLQVVGDGSYRVALVDLEGMKNPGDTEYFIRALEDRVPEVHLRKPARDRSVTMLEEVQILADAEDDFGIDRLELVYAVRGGAEQVVPLRIAPQSASVTASHTLYLEDLGVRPGDFVSYYVRAHDRGRGRRSSEGRSDIFFLEVKPFEQEFVLARSLASGGADRTVDDLVSAQKEVIVATWKLDRRSQAAKGAKSEQDIRAVAQAEAELKKRVEETSSSFRETNLRDPRPRAPQPGRGQPDVPRAGQARPEEDAMTAAATAMGKAVESLNALRTGAAIPPEMDALNHLLRAQADVKRLQVARQASNGAGNRSTQDLSSLFDRELQREQQTNYETPATTGQQNNDTSLADKVKELARRQDELNQRQQAAERMTAEERRRELEKLTRDQTDLRQRAEELTKQVEQQQSSQGSRGSRGSQGSVGSQGSPGSQNAQGSQGSRAGEQMRSVSEEMRNAAGDLQRQNPRQASARGARAVQSLQELERELRTSGPDQRRRALGETQLEVRQLADAERQIASELNRIRGSQGSQGSTGAADRDALRRLAGEQERLADRARQVQSGLDQQAAALAGAPGSGSKDDLQRAVGAAAADLNRQRLPDRMQQSADQLRAAAGQSSDQQANDQAAKAAAAQEAVARDLDSLADKLASAQTPTDEGSRRLAEQRGRAQELREEINRLMGEIERLGQQSSPGSQPSPGDAGRSGRGQAGTGGSGGELVRLRQEYAQRLQEARSLLEQMRRDDPSFSQGGPGLTLEGRGMTLSAPGTEAFKQDFAKWEQLRQQASLLLTQAESSLSQRLQAKMAQDRLAAGAADRAPAAYQKQVDEYFKTLATPNR